MNDLAKQNEQFAQTEKLIVDDLRGGDAKAALAKALMLVKDGCPSGYLVIAGIYEVGKGGVDEDLDKAKSYYEKAIEEDKRDIAYLGLARLHMYGNRAWCDYGKAYECYKIVAERYQDNAFANFMLGKMYFFGQSVNVDYQQAKLFFEKGWEKGHILSLTYLGLTEQKLGNYFKGWVIRLKALRLGFKFAFTDDDLSLIKNDLNRQK